MKDNKKKIAAYDIETIARPLSNDVINELCKTGNLVKPELIAKKQAEFRGKLGANPLTAMACCGGWYASDDDCGYMMLKDMFFESEKDFLRKYWAKLAEYDILVGFNSFSFDSKTIIIRSAVHGIEMPFKIDRKKYSTTGNHIDIRMVLQDWNTFEAGKLSFFLDMFGLESKTEGIDGSQVQDYWNEGLHQDIGEYCLNDCKQTFQLFEKIKRYFL
ncbi:MAG: ribonuclease H-like domain-containing protein [Deltaproteobacteria bacterium]|nr:ribonuclease H-like domain-containing protein [Deltaproteobacteria bacterium]